MEAKIADVTIFRALFQYLTKFIEVAHFEINKDMMRIRGIDPHDFCYVDIKLFPEFFEDFVVENKLNFAIELSKLSRILVVLTARQIFIRTDEGYISLSTKENWLSSFRVKWLRSDPYVLPEPNTLDYEATVDIPAKELADIIQKASAISHEISFSAEVPNKLTVFALTDNYSFTAQPCGSHFKINVRQPASVSIIANYLKMLNYLISKCESAKLFIGNDKPLRVDLIYGNKGVFSLSLSHKKKEKTVREKTPSERAGTSLPRISMKIFEKYLIQLSRFPDGAYPQILEMAGLETKGKDCWRLCDILTLAYKDEGKIKLTPLGEAFASLYEKDEKKAKQFMHILAKKTILPYKLMVETIKTPLFRHELHERINTILEKKAGYRINGQDISTLLEIAKWCGILNKKKSLLSFKAV
ncbi:MAG: hypothetical protein QXF61_08140 [Nitrososphaeria archaeon]